MMTQAPERIWINTDGNSQTYLHGPNRNHVTEYIRADLVPQWQPIETAPKDGVIDIWLSDGVRWCDCYYDRICDEWR
ncbi:MAG: hypothetical protein ACRCYS_20015, partial [Beijerinckiaceae bacterium]